MPHTNSAKKRLRQSEKRRLYNRAVIKGIKNQLKKVASVAESGSADDLKTECGNAIQQIDKAAARRVVHPNMASRKKSQIARLLNKKQGAAKK